MKEYKVLDLFAGGGGFSTGFLAASYKDIRFKLSAALELDEAACQTLINNYGEEKVISGDITNPMIKEAVIEKCRDVDLIIGGPPCQTFSLAGPARSGRKDLRDKLREDPRNTLYRHFFDLVKRIQPSFVVFENVEGIASKKVENETLSSKQRAVIDLVCEDLNELGYYTKIKESSDTEKNRDYQVLNSADYGVPQYRKRIIIIANKFNLLNPVPEKTHGSNLKNHRTVHDAISHLPIRLPRINPNGMRKLKNMDVIIHNYKKTLRIFKKSIKENIANDPVYEKFWRWFQKEYKKLTPVNENHIDVLKDFFQRYNSKLNEVESQSVFLISETIHTSRMHNFRDIIIFILTNPGSNSAKFINKEREDFNKFLSELYPYARNKHTDTYVKHRWDRPSYTILAHMEKDGLKFIHPEQPRTYTPYEAALLQSFPIDFVFKGGRNAQYRQIGNAVPPLMAEAIGSAILKTIHENQGVIQGMEACENL